MENVGVALIVTDRSKIFLINEEGNFELVQYEQINTITKENSAVRAFIFNRNNKNWVVYWHISGSGQIELPVNLDKVKLYKEIGEEIKLQENTENVTVPVGDRKYLKFDLPRTEVLDLFSKKYVKLHCLPEVLVRVRTSNDFFARRKNIKRAKEVMALKFDATKSFGFGIKGYFYALAHFVLFLLPSGIKTILYKKLRD